MDGNRLDSSGNAVLAWEQAAGAVVGIVHCLTHISGRLNVSGLATAQETLPVLWERYIESQGVIRSLERELILARRSAGLNPIVRVDIGIDGELTTFASAHHAAVMAAGALWMDVWRVVHRDSPGIETRLALTLDDPDCEPALPIEVQDVSELGACWGEILERLLWLTDLDGPRLLAEIRIEGAAVASRAEAGTAILGSENAGDTEDSGRPAAGRDHYLHALGLSPAKARDHWNALPEPDRRRIGGSCFQAINSATAKKGIQTARKEKV